MGKLTDRVQATGVTLNNSIIHVVNTDDTTQNPSGSSYKADLGQILSLGPRVTGGTYNSSTETIDFSGTQLFNPFSVDVSSLLDDTNTFTTGVTLNGTILEFDRNDGSNIYNVDLSGLTSNFTGNTSGDCISDFWVSNIHSCSPLNINPLDEGNVYFGSTSGLTIDVTNSRLGIGTTTPTEKLDVSGNTKISGSLNIGTILSGTPLINLGIDSSGNVVTGTTWDGGSNYILVKAQGTDLENGQELQTAYNLAQTFSPLSGNVITIIAAPGYYNFGSSAFTMDTPYIDLVSLDGNRSIIFNSTLNSTSFSARTEGSISVSGNNISIKGVDVLDKNFTIESNLNSISIENCRGGDYSFGGVEDGDTPIVVSGEFINCIGGDLSFGGNGAASGIFKNCEGKDFSFAGAETTGGFASGRFLDCVGGDESFGFSELTGEFINCKGSDFSFGFAGAIDTTIFENCEGGAASFGSNGIYIFLSEINNSKGGVFSFGSNIQIIFDAEFNNCIGGLDSFGKDFTVLNDGRFYRCRLTSGTFDTPDVGGFIILGIDGDNNVQNITGI